MKNESSPLTTLSLDYFTGKMWTCLLLLSLNNRVEKKPEFQVLFPHYSQTCQQPLEAPARVTDGPGTGTGFVTLLEHLRVLKISEHLFLEHATLERACYPEETTRAILPSLLSLISFRSRHLWDRQS